MSYSHSIPASVRLSRTQLVGMVVAVAALTAAVTWAVSSLAFDTAASGGASSSQTSSSRVGAAKRTPASFTMTRTQIEGLSTMAQQERRADPLMSTTPAQLAGLGLGTGYQLPTEQGTRTGAAVLASMSPATRRYTESILNLTFEQLAAGGAGQP